MLGFQLDPAGKNGTDELTVSYCLHRFLDNVILKVSKRTRYNRYVLIGSALPAFTGDIASFTADTNVKADGICGWNLVNVLLLVSGIGSTRVNLSIELIFGMKTQNPPLSPKTKQSTTTQNQLISHKAHKHKHQMLLLPMHVQTLWYVCISIYTCMCV